MTRDRLRPAALARKVLLPPALGGAAVACLLAILAIASPDGSRARAANPLGGKPEDAAQHSRRVVTALATDLEGTPAPRDIRRARKPLPERLRLLARHPYWMLYVRAQRRYSVPWVLVASIHYQETGFERAGSQAKLVMAIGRQLREAQASRSLGDAATHAVLARYGADPAGRVSAAMVVERARAWRLLGTLPKPGRGELATPVAGFVGGCGYFGCPRPGHLHNGVDFLAPSGAPVRAADAGTVAVAETSGESGGYGKFVCLQHRPHLATCYAHLSTIADGVVEGARLGRGAVLGLVGSTGSSSAPHLHFEARLGPAACQSCAVDPLPLLSGDVPQSRVPRLLRASANAGRAVGAANVPSAATTGRAALEDIEVERREPQPLIPITPATTEPAPTPATPPREPAAPTGGASVESPPEQPTAAAAPPPTAEAATPAAPEGGASPTATPP